MFSERARLLMARFARSSVNSDPAIIASGLGNENLLTLERAKPAGIMSIDTFSSHWMRNPRLGRRGGYSLGSTSRSYEAVSQRMGLTTWTDAYDAFGISRDEPRTDEFLRRLTAEGCPIVFFVPSRVLSHDGTTSNVTRDEMRWFLANPDRTRNVYFVFGLY